MRRALLLLAITACEDREPERAKPSPPVHAPPSTREECIAAAKGDLGSPGGTGLGADVNAKLRESREEVIVRLCVEDRWPADVSSCYAKAQGLMEIGRCWLPPPASTHLTEALQDTMRRGLGLPR